MRQTTDPIDAALLLINPEVSGASVVVALDRPIEARFTSLEIEDDGVYLIGDDNSRRRLADVSVVDAQTVAEMNVVVVKEMLPAADKGGFEDHREYSIEVADLTASPDRCAGDGMAYGPAL